MKQLKVLILVAIAAISFASCKTKEKIVEVPTIKTEYVNMLDTLIIKDSIYIDKIIEKKGDTTFITKNNIVYKDRYHTIKYDSIKHDTVTVEKQVEKVVYQNKLNWFQSLLCYCGFAALLILLIYIAKKFVKP